MNIKVFNIRLSKEHCQSDQERMNNFLDLVEVKLTSTNFVTTGSTDFWSAAVFFEPKSVKKEKAKFLHDELSPKEREIFNALRTWRNTLAEKKNWSYFQICHNAHLASIAKINPQTIENLANDTSFGLKRTEKYGEEVLAVLNAL
ncbi:HRDC domain-containing protein [Flavobacterium sp. XGLA_31]|uniref:HRDC domain-containing protein n=1 Tax=Flavobacterium sp. XGLA_31 TaxID=3447666 RepID=UPI003F3F568E